ncbi:hypothetical protein [Polaromonas sp. SM01]|uniref:hypothetical protein n=1 Tax=Polaromonas sp. SM01 TaxID=3085630 RepID=UPI00298155BB|nr:hypothetical protein [Polaromonas sp. SM01]MDW5443875.1 hypothetical protein [Polaromonas sp. SM01]
MNPKLWTPRFTLLGTRVGGLLRSAVKQPFKHPLLALPQPCKTGFMVEETARHVLSQQSFTAPSFAVLKKHLGDFGDNELRKTLKICRSVVCSCIQSNSRPKGMGVNSYQKYSECMTQTFLAGAIPVVIMAMICPCS